VGKFNAGHATAGVCSAALACSSLAAPETQFKLHMNNTFTKIDGFSLILGIVSKKLGYVIYSRKIPFTFETVKLNI
jgi:hypothetical protein